MIQRLFLTFWFVVASMVSLARSEDYQYRYAEGSKMSVISGTIQEKTYFQVRDEIAKKNAELNALTLDVAELEALFATMTDPTPAPEPEPIVIPPVILDADVPVLVAGVNWDGVDAGVYGVNWGDVQTLVPEYIDWTKDKSVLYAPEKPRVRLQVAKKTPPVVVHGRGIQVSTCVDEGDECYQSRGFAYSKITARDL